MYSSLLINVILNQHFFDTRCLLIFSDNNQLSYNTSLPTINIIVLNGTFESEMVFRNFGCQGILVDTKMPVTTFLNLERAINKAMERFDKRRYLIAPAENSTENPLDIFKTKAVDFVADLLIVYPKMVPCCDQNVWFNFCSMNYLLYSHKFVGNQSNDVELLDEWFCYNSSFVHDKNLYPNKLLNMEGRAMTFVTIEYIPTTVLESNEGLELQLALEFAYKHNIIPNITTDDDYNAILGNWTEFTVVRKIFTDDGDLGFGAVYLNTMYDYVDVAVSNIRCAVTCVVPGPTLYNGWFAIFFPYSYNMWAAVAGSFCVTSLFVSILECIQRKRIRWAFIENSVLNTAAALLLQGIQKTNLKSRGKYILYTSVFIFSLLIVSAYNSGMSSSMTIPRYTGAIETIQELRDSGMPWGAGSNLWVSSLDDSEEENDLKLASQFQVTTKDKYSQKWFGFAVERYAGGYFSYDNYITEENLQQQSVMNEDLYWGNPTFMLRKSSIWTPLVQLFNYRIAQTGILYFWELLVTAKYTNMKIQRALRNPFNYKQKRPPVKLKLNHMQGAFVLLLIGITLSALSFFIEILKFSHKQI